MTPLTAYYALLGKNEDYLILIGGVLEMAVILNLLCSKETRSNYTLIYNYLVVVNHFNRLYDQL